MEEFTTEQRKLLERFVTNTDSNIFVLRNLPDVIKGALFSRYSRSTLGLRTLLLKEFITSDETSFHHIAGEGKGLTEEAAENQLLAVKKAQNFYDRILDGYGDDSIGELGGAHIAIENVSILATKILEDSRIGGSPLEKSTRYIFFDQKKEGQYLFYREPVLMTSAFKDLYVDTCNLLFDTYSKLIPNLTEVTEARFPREPEMSKSAYTASVRAKVLDSLRGLLPASTLTNMGIFGNGRFYEYLINKLQIQSLAESAEIGKKMYNELSKAIPSFVRRAELGHRHQESFARFREAMDQRIQHMAKQYTSGKGRETAVGVTLVCSDPKAPAKVAAALLYPYCQHGMQELLEVVGDLPEDEINQILETAARDRGNRRQKSPRALENAEYTFEILTDYGIYRDLHRHRTFTQERQLLTCSHGYYTPPEIIDTQAEAPYHEALEKAKKAYDVIAKEFPEEAQYIVPMAYNIRWYFHGNLRALQWMCELRSTPAGHPHYRYIAQEMAKEVLKAHPQFERFFKFVDYEGYELGRLGQELRKAEKLNLD